MADSSAVAADRSPRTRAKHTNDPFARLPGTDGRSQWGRRRADLVRALRGELADDLDARAAILISNAAAIIVRCEQLGAMIVRGEEVDTDQVVRLANVASRLLAALRRQPHKGRKASDLFAYLKSIEERAPERAGCVSDAPGVETPARAEQRTSGPRKRRAGASA